MQLGQVHFSRQSGTKTFSKTFFKTCLKALLRKTRKKTPTAAEFVFRLFGSFFLQLQTAQIMAAVLQISDSKQALTFFAGHNSDTKRTGQNCGENFKNFFEHFFEDFFDNFFENPAPKTRKETETAAENLFCDFSAVFSSTFIAFNEKN